MSKSDDFENAMLLLVFNNSNIANIGYATGLRGSSAAGSLYVSLHAADPGETGTAVTNEANYTSYARVAVARASGAGGWTVSANQVQNTSTITFPACTGGSNTITHFGVVTSASGAGTLLYKGALTPNIAVSTGITPTIGAGVAGLSISED